MPVETSVAVVLAVERSRYTELISNLVRFRYFQFEQEREPINPDLIARLEQLCTKLSILAERIGAPKDMGVLDAILEGYSEQKVERLEAEDIENLVEELEKNANNELRELEEIVERLDTTQKELEEQVRVRDAIWLYSRIKTDIDKIRNAKRLYLDIVAVPRRDLKELKRSLRGKAELYCEAMGKDVFSCVLAAHWREKESVDRILKAFDVTSIRIPEGLPSVPAEAYGRLQEKINSLQMSIRKLERRLEQLKREKTRKLSTLLEAATLLKSEVERMRVPQTRLRRVAVLTGYVPSSMYDDFRRLFGAYLIGSATRTSEEPPTLIRNGRYTKNFEAVTLTQGPPSPREVDPTPIISVVFPAFFGLMFGDVGHGILLALTGLLLRLRGYEELRKWGTALISFGVSSAIIGAVTGEIFGLPLYGYKGLALNGVRLPLLHVGELSAEVALQLLGIALIVGVMHIAMGLGLDFYKAIRNREVAEGLLEKLTALVLYVAGVFYSLAFIYSGYDFSSMWAANPTPLGISTNMITQVTLPILLAMSLLIIVSKPVLAIKTGHNLMEGAIEGIIEWLLKIIEFMANTMSYARLAVLLLVHAALLYVVNMGFSLGPAGIGVVAIGNIGVVMLEGLIVYIQDLRLHVYEWFTKFYEGTGRLFKPITLKGKRVELLLAA